MNIITIDKKPFKDLLEALIQEFGEGEDLSTETATGLTYFRYRWPEFEIYQPFHYNLLFYRPCKPIRKLSQRLCNESAEIGLFVYRCCTDYREISTPEEGLKIIKNTHNKTMGQFKKAKKYFRKLKDETKNQSK